MITPRSWAVCIRGTYSDAPWRKVLEAVFCFSYASSGGSRQERL